MPCIIKVIPLLLAQPVHAAFAKPALEMTRSRPSTAETAAKTAWAGIDIHLSALCKVQMRGVLLLPSIICNKRCKPYQGRHLRLADPGAFVHLPALVAASGSRYSFPTPPGSTAERKQTGCGR
jgi:hypothetical protein